MSDDPGRGVDDERPPGTDEGSESTGPSRDEPAGERDPLIEESEAAEQGAGSSARNLFDLRYIIGALFGCYGVLLVIYSLLGGGGAAELVKAGGMHINLEAGIVMLFVAAFFAVWATWRPVKVPPPEKSSAEQESDEKAAPDSR